MWPVATTFNSRAAECPYSLNFLCLKKGQKQILCIHCMLLSFNLQTNKIQHKLHYGFTVSNSLDGEQSI